MLLLFLSVLQPIYLGIYVPSGLEVRSQLLSYGIYEKHTFHNHGHNRTHLIRDHFNKFS